MSISASGGDDTAWSPHQPPELWGMIIRAGEKGEPTMVVKGGGDTVRCRTWMHRTFLLLNREYARLVPDETKTHFLLSGENVRHELDLGPEVDLGDYLTNDATRLEAESRLLRSKIANCVVGLVPRYIVKDGEESALRKSETDATVCFLYSLRADGKLPRLRDIVYNATTINLDPSENDYSVFASPSESICASSNKLPSEMHIQAHLLVPKEWYGPVYLTANLPTDLSIHSHINHRPQPFRGTSACSAMRWYTWGCMSDEDGFAYIDENVPDMISTDFSSHLQEGATFAILCRDDIRYKDPRDADRKDARDQELSSALAYSISNTPSSKTRFTLENHKGEMIAMTAGRIEEIEETDVAL